MSVLFALNECVLISHEKFINQIYSNYVKVQDDGKQFDYRIASELFELNVPYRNEIIGGPDIRRRRRKAIDKRQSKEIKDNPEEYELIERIKLKTHEFLTKCRDKGFLLSSAEEPKNNAKLKEFLNNWNDVPSSSFPQFYAENATDNIEITQSLNERFVIPPKCSIYCKDVEKIDWCKLQDSYDLLVIDPPWWNKYVRRTKAFNGDNGGYQMLSNDLIEKIPVERVIAANRTTVAVWCTNSPAMIKAVKESFLPKWKLKLVATWYWIKITKFGETICDFNLPLKKQPFERLFIARPIESSDDSNEIPKERLFFSIPSAIHSHKPPLEELLAPYLTKPAVELKNLEIFSRYLLPNWTSIGLEVLKLQNIRLFEGKEMCL